MSGADQLAAAARHGRLKQLFNAVCDLPNATAQRAALQALGVDLPLAAYAVILLTATLAAFGTAPVPSASLFMLAAVLAADFVLEWPQSKDAFAAPNASRE